MMICNIFKHRTTGAFLKGGIGMDEKSITPLEFRDFLMEYAKETIEKEDPDRMIYLPDLLKTITDLTALFHDA